MTDDTMSDTASSATRTPVHYWVVTVLAVFWNAFGAYDYVMSRTHNAAYIEKMMPGVDSAAVFAWMDKMPILASIGWGLGIWTAVAGAILMIVRHRLAVIAFLASLVGMALSFPLQWMGPPPPTGVENRGMEIFVIAVGVFFFAYCRWAKQRGLLR